MKKEKNTLIDGSKLIIESTVRAGGEIFIGYPITPANLLYLYSSKRFPASIPAPDEISTAQWMTGFAAAGKLPVTATSFPGFALMLESINLAYMMELPMVIILAQRLGPSTGTATGGATGDVQLINGMISGGYPVPTLCISNFDDCWKLPPVALEMAEKLRTPVILLTSKEIVMTLQSFDISTLDEITAIKRSYYESDRAYQPYKPAANLVPPFLPVCSTGHQVRLTASTHDMNGMIQHTSAPAMENTRRLQEKLMANLSQFCRYELDEQKSDTLIAAYDVTTQAAREATNRLRDKGKAVSLLVMKTLFPIPEVYIEIMARYKRIVIAEENLNGQYREILFGRSGRTGVIGVNAIGRMITPQEIMKGVES